MWINSYDLQKNSRKWVLLLPLFYRRKNSATCRRPIQLSEEIWPQSLSIWLLLYRAILVVVSMKMKLNALARLGKRQSRRCPQLVVRCRKKTLKVGRKFHKYLEKFCSEASLWMTLKQLLYVEESSHTWFRPGVDKLSIKDQLLNI